MLRIAAWIVGLVLIVGIGATLLLRPGSAGAERQAEVATVVRPVRGLSLEQWRRQVLYDLLQPVKLSNCVMERFGETYDGGYLLCSNLLKDARWAYSYGISGYDKRGCDVASRYSIPVHQYDCFNPTRPVCSTGKTVFHEECVGGARTMVEGRSFDTIAGQFERNGDAGKNIVMKMDVEGSEWDSFMTAPEAVFDKVDQLAIELHGINEDRVMTVITHLKRHFYLVNVHYNNYTCSPLTRPLPGDVYEALFVNKRIGVLDPNGKPEIPNPLDRPNNPKVPDCQTSPDSGR